MVSVSRRGVIGYRTVFWTETCFAARSNRYWSASNNSAPCCNVWLVFRVSVAARFSLTTPSSFPLFLLLLNATMLLFFFLLIKNISLDVKRMLVIGEDAMHVTCASAKCSRKLYGSCITAFYWKLGNFRDTFQWIKLFITIRTIFSYDV